MTTRKQLTLSFERSTLTTISQDTELAKLAKDIAKLLKAPREKIQAVTFVLTTTN